MKQFLTDALNSATAGQITSLDDLTGRTIHKCIIVGSSAMMAFTDRTYAIFDIERGYDNDVELVLSKDPLSEYDNGGWLGDIGFVTAEDVGAERLARRRKDEAEQVERQRRDYEKMKADVERLKARFEPTG